MVAFAEDAKRGQEAVVNCNLSHGSSPAEAFLVRFH